MVVGKVRAYGIPDFQLQRRLQTPTVDTAMSLTIRDPMRMMPNQTPMVPYKVCFHENRKKSHRVFFHWILT
jgi:hypothetical protein